MIPLITNTIDDRDILDLINFLSQNPQPRLSKGELTIEFEKKFSEFLGCKYSVFVNSGSSAILLSLYSLIQSGRFKNNIIATPALSWVTDVTSVLQLGLKPVLVDCNMEDLSCDLNDLERVFRYDKPSALILVSVLGLVPNMAEIISLCDKYGVILIEDCCESLGSEFCGKKLGTFGSLSCFSTFFSHHFSTIEGGLISTDDFELYEMLLSLRSHGWSRDLSFSTKQKLNNEWRIDNFRDLYTFYYNGFNLRPTDLQARIGLSQLPKLTHFVKKRNKNFNIYLDKIKNNELKISNRETDFCSNFAYPFVHKNINDIIKELHKNHIEIRPIIAGSMGNKPFWINYNGGKKSPMHHADLIDKFGIYIPNSHELSEQQIDFICSILNSF